MYAFGKNLIREPDAGNPHVRFDERGRETGSCDGLRHRLPAKAAGQRLLPIAPATAPVPDSTNLSGPESRDFKRASGNGIENRIVCRRSKPTFQIAEEC